MNRHTIRNSLAALLILVLRPALPLAADIEPDLSIGSVAELAVSGNPELTRIQRRLDAALDRLGWEPYRDDLALALRGSVSGETLDDLFGAGSATLDLAVEVIPQLTVTGELVGRLDTSEAGPLAPYGASIGLVLDPLADTHRRDREELAVDEAALELEAATRGVAADAIERLLAAVRSQDRVPLLESALAVAEQRLERTEALAERDRATAADVSQAGDSLRAARQTVERARLEADRARLRLAQSLRIRADELVLPGTDELALERYVARIREWSAAIDAADLVDATEAVAEARVNLESARIAAAAARRFTPELSASAAMTFPGPAYSLGLSLQMRPSDWDAAARGEAAMDLAFAERAYESTRLTKELDLRIARLALDQAFENLEAARIALGLAGIDLKEVLFFLDRGEATALDVSQAELELSQADSGVWNAHAAIVNAWTAIDLARF